MNLTHILCFTLCRIGLLSKVLDKLNSMSILLFRQEPPSILFGGLQVAQFPLRGLVSHVRFQRPCLHFHIYFCYIVGIITLPTLYIMPYGEQSSRKILHNMRFFRNCRFALVRQIHTSVLYRVLRWEFASMGLGREFHGAGISWRLAGSVPRIGAGTGTIRGTLNAIRYY